jgi:hypothetical protein
LFSEEDARWVIQLDDESFNATVFCNGTSSSVVPAVAAAAAVDGSLTLKNNLTVREARADPLDLPIGDAARCNSSYVINLCAFSFFE